MTSTRPILLVEDDTDIMNTMIDFFNLIGRKILIAKNGKKGIELIKSLNPHNYPSCIILDLMMPEMSGEEFIYHIQALGKRDLDSIPIIVSSASNIVDNMDEPRVVKKLKKPVNLDDLEEISSTYY